jgi:hypothetical protein
MLPAEYFTWVVEIYLRALVATDMERRAGHGAGREGVGFAERDLMPGEDVAAAMEPVVLADHDPAVPDVIPHAKPPAQHRISGRRRAHRESGFDACGGAAWPKQTVAAVSHDGARAHMGDAQKSQDFYKWPGGQDRSRSGPGLKKALDLRPKAADGAIGRDMATMLQELEAGACEPGEAGDGAPWNRGIVLRVEHVDFGGVEGANVVDGIVEGASAELVPVFLS